MWTATISTKGWVVIPKEYRDKYGLRPGRKALFIDYGGVLALAPVPDDPVAEGYGCLSALGDDETWSATLLKERAEERAREEANAERHLRA